MGVSPQTLRAWANEGRVQTYRTPGGHRRFQVDPAATTPTRSPRRSETRWRLLEHSALGQLHLLLDGQSESAQLLAALAPTARVTLRERARDLIRLGVESLARDETDMRGAADALARSFADWQEREGIGPLAAFAALAVIRRAFAAAIVEYAFGLGEPGVDELNRWLGRANDIIDRVCLSMVQYGVEGQSPDDRK